MSDFKTTPQNTRLAIILLFVLALVFLLLMFCNKNKDGTFKITKDGVEIEVTEMLLNNLENKFRQEVASMEKLKMEDLFRENKALRDSINKLINERNNDISTANDLARRFAVYHDELESKPELLNELFSFLSKSENPDIDLDYSSLAKDYALNFLTGEKNQLMAALGDLEAKLEEVNKEKERLLLNISDKNSKITELQKDLEFLKKQLSELVGENQSNVENNALLQAKVDSLERKISIVQSELLEYQPVVDRNPIKIVGAMPYLITDGKTIKVSPKTGQEYLIKNNKPLTIKINFNVEFLKNLNAIVLYAACEEPNGNVIDTKPVHIKGRVIQYSQSITLDKSKLKDLNVTFQFTSDFPYGKYDISFFTESSSDPIYYIPIELKRKL